MIVSREHLAVAIVALAATIVRLVDAPGAVQIPLVLAFLVFCPGMAWTRRLEPGSWWDRLAVSVGVSLAAEALVGELMALTDRWNADVAFLGLVAFTAAGLVIRGRRSDLDVAMGLYDSGRVVRPRRPGPSRRGGEMGE